jgi:hypothetical protein
MLRRKNLDTMSARPEYVVTLMGSKILRILGAFVRADSEGLYRDLTILKCTKR